MPSCNRTTYTAIHTQISGVVAAPSFAHAHAGYDRQIDQTDKIRD